jgi:chemotaxis protein MotA
VGFANILCLPIGGRIKLAVRDGVQRMEMMLTGVLAIQEGMNPKLVRERLGEFLHKEHGAEKGKAGGAAAETAKA